MLNSLAIKPTFFAVSELATNLSDVSSLINVKSSPKDHRFAQQRPFLPSGAFHSLVKPSHRDPNASSLCLGFCEKNWLREQIAVMICTCKPQHREKAAQSVFMISFRSAFSILCDDKRQRTRHVTFPDLSVTFVPAFSPALHTGGALYLRLLILRGLGPFILLPHTETLTNSYIHRYFCLDTLCLPNTHRKSDLGARVMIVSIPLPLLLPLFNTPQRPLLSPTVQSHQ